jgi:integrase
MVDLASAGTKRQQRFRSGFATKAEAIADMHKMQTAKAVGAYVEPTTLTLGDYLRDWLASGCGGVRGSTLAGYRVCVERHIVPRIGNIALQALTRMRIQALYGELATSGNTRGGGLAPKSVHNVQVCLHAALEEAVRNKLIVSNPADGSHKKPRDRPEMKIWTLEELRAFLAAAVDHQDFVLYRTAAQTGMRRGELLGLRWRDLDLEAGVLNVRQQWSRQDTQLCFGPPKTKKGLRSIDLDPGTIDALRQQRQRVDLQRRACGRQYQSDLDLVFPCSRGGPQDPDVVYRRFARLVDRLSKRLGIQRIRFHDLRHTHATLLLQDGLDGRYVSERLGHDSVQTTLELYAHVTSKRRRDAARRIGAMLDEVVEPLDRQPNPREEPTPEDD